MGALTADRKRCFVDLLVPLSSSSSFTHIQSDSSPSFAKLKKQKVSNPVQLADPRPSPPPSPPSSSTPVQSCSRRFSSPYPLRRPVHGPQRIIKAFGRVLSSSIGPEIRVPQRMTDQKETVGASRGPAKRSSEKSYPSSSRGRDPQLDGERIEELKLEEYRKLVENLQADGSVEFVEKKSLESVSVDTSYSWSVSSDVHEGTRLSVEEDASPKQLKTIEGRTTPLYKDLLLSARKRDSRLSTLDFEVKLAEKKISEFRIELKEETKEDLLGPFTPLTDEEEEEVNLALRDCAKFRLPKHEVLVLHEGSNIEITRDVIQCLRHGAWLNDEVINLYFELLKEREKREPKKFLQCHFFNTFFYKKLTGGRGNYDFKAVRRWTTQRKLGYGLIECDKIFVPIHKEIHWCLAVIDVKNEKLLYLDSLGGWDCHVLSMLARYLEDEVKDKNNMTIDATSWKQVKVNGQPLQKNGWDCGMFMIKYADFISRRLDLCFQQENMTYFRKRTANEILRLRAE